MTWLDAVAQSGVTFALSTVVYCLVAAALGLATLVCVPGIWLMILLAFANEALNGFVFARPGGWVAWIAIGVASLIAFAAEVFEFLAGAMGAKAAGASRRGMVGAMMGSVVGAVGGTAIMPVIGTLIGAIAGAALGAVIGELSSGARTLRGSVVPAAGAAGGRLVGTLAKVIFAAAAWICLVVGAIVR